MYYYTGYEVYTAALALIDENEYRGDPSDLQDRASYILATCCATCRKLDKKIREFNSYPPQSDFSSLYLDLEDDFPLCDILSAPVATYLASMLVTDENPELAQTLYDRYCDAIATIGASWECSAIEDVYFND